MKKRYEWSWICLSLFRRYEDPDGCGGTTRIFTLKPAWLWQYRVEFDLHLSDIVIPLVCPVLGIPLRVNHSVTGPNSPSVDRINPSGGYTKGNVTIISLKANTIKSNATIAEVRQVLAYMESHAK